MRGGLKGFADAKKPSVDLLRDVQTHVVAQGVKNSGVGRESHKIHVSEVVKDTACPRYLYFKVSKAERTDPAVAAFHRLEMIWAAGHDAHRKWQNWLREMGDLWGTWTCLSCENYSWEALSPDMCPKCNSELLRYDEVNLEDEVYPLVGHADGAVPRLEALVEVKSFAVGTVRIENPALVRDNTHKIGTVTVIDHEGIWKAIKRPLRSHLVQGQFYLWLCKRMGLPYKKIIFIYENKTTQATKTFEVTLSERFIQEQIDILEEVMQAVQVGVAPPIPKMFAKDAKPCKECPFRTGCYDDAGTESAAVPAPGPISGGEEASGEAAVQPAPEAEAANSGGSGGHHRTRRSRVDRDDDAADEVGRAHRSPVGDGRGGRTVGRSGDGQVPSPRFTRRQR